MIISFLIAFFLLITWLCCTDLKTIMKMNVSPSFDIKKYKMAYVEVKGGNSYLGGNLDENLTELGLYPKNLCSKPPFFNDSDLIIKCSYKFALGRPKFIRRPQFNFVKTLKLEFIDAVSKKVLLTGYYSRPLWGITTYPEHVINDFFNMLRNKLGRETIKMDMFQQYELLQKNIEMGKELKKENQKKTNHPTH